jgi:hypothetical protein
MSWLYANGQVPHLKNVRVHGGDNVVEEVRLSGEQLFCGIAHHLLGLLGVLGSNAVPKVVFSQAIMQRVLAMIIGKECRNFNGKAHFLKSSLITEGAPLKGYGKSQCRSSQFLRQRLVEVIN